MTIRLGIALGLIPLIAAAQGPVQPQLSHPAFRGVVLDIETNRGVPGVSVILAFTDSLPKFEQTVASTTTGPDGSFVFPARDSENSPTGTFFYHVTKSGYVEWPWDKQDAEGLFASSGNAVQRLTMIKTGGIKGQVVDDETGQPLANFPVSIAGVHYYHGKPSAEEPGGMAVTDKDGQFIYSDLRPAVFAIVTLPQDVGWQELILDRFSPNDLRTLDRDYTRAYWPGGRSREFATPISVKPGQIIDLGVLRLTKVTYPKVHVAISGIDCKQDFKLDFHLLAGAADLRLPPFLPSSLAPCRTEFLIEGVTAGSYTLKVTAQLGDDKLTAIIPLETLDKNIDVIAVLKHKTGVDLNVRFTPAARFASRIACCHHVTLAPMNRPGADGWLLTPIRIETPSGEFTFETEYVAKALEPGLYRVDAGAYAGEIRYNGKQLIDGLLSVDDRVSGQVLEIVLRDSAGEIAGTVVDGSVPAKEAFLVWVKWPASGDTIFSTDWELQPAVPLGMNGTFSLGGLVRGGYRVVAVPLSMRPKLQEPDILEGLLNRAKTITVGAEVVRNVRLELAKP